MRKERFIYDKWLLCTAFAIVALGLLMVASASMVISDRQYHTPFFYLFRQLAYLVVALVAAFFATRIKISQWYKWSGYLLMVSYLLLIAVLIPGVGHEVNGSIRWIRIGPVSLQVSECVKFFMVVFMAGYLVRRAEEVKSQVMGFLKPMFLLGLMGVLLLIEPDFGATTVIIATVLGMMFMAGVRLWQYAVLMAGVGAGLASLVVFSPYRMERLMAFLHPWANQFSSGYQLTQSLIAFGRGGIFGVGLGNSMQKLFYLPEAHTDFLFAVLAEELGVIGQLSVIALFILLIGRGLYIARCAHKSEQLFAAYVAYGCSLWLGLQTMINIGVNAGLLPTKGLTLPLMSYGGSSLLIDGVVIGVLLRIAHDMRSMPARLGFPKTA